MTEEQIKHMTDRFLGWKLPQNFQPDAGISYTRPNYHPSADATPTGTNLFDATQAEAMVRFMIEGMPVDGTPLSQISGRPGHGGFEEFVRIANSWGYE